MTVLTLEYKHLVGKPNNQQMWGEVNIRIEGHSGFDMVGKDIVCAAISTLTYTLINELERIRSREMLKVEYSQEEGKMHIHAKLNGYRVGECLDTILTGYRMIQEHFPENFTIIEHWKNLGEVGEK